VSGARRLAVRAGYFGAGFRAVFERDFLVLTSAGRFVALRTGVMCVLGALTVTVLVQLAGDGSGGVHSPDQVGRGVFTTFAFAYPLLVLLIGPALAAGSIAGERSLDTLPLVLAAPIHPAALVLAKFLSRLGALLLPLVGGLPVAAICFLYGGISKSLFAEWVLVVLALAAAATAASVVASAYARTVAGAVLVGYLLAVVLQVADFALAAVVEEALRGATMPWILDHTGGHALRSIWKAAQGRGATGSGVATFLATAAAATAVALLLAGARVAREQAGGARGARAGRARRQIFRNPVLDRACLALPLRRNGFAPWTALLVVAALTLPAPFLLGDADVVLGAMTLCTAATAVVVLARASQSVATERQQGSLAVLLSTRLTSAEVLRGHVLGLAAQAALLLLPGLALGVAAAAGWVPVGEDRRAVGVLFVAAWLAASAVVLLLAAAIGLWTSARAVTAGKAAGLAFGLTVGGGVAHLLVCGGVVLAGTTAVQEPLLLATPLAQVAALPWMTLAPTQTTLAWTVFWLVADVVAALLLLDDARERIEEAPE
jgi:ABC-type transport system involved in multi-copper enzyme maturation permease subunit